MLKLALQEWRGSCVALAAVHNCQALVQMNKWHRTRWPYYSGKLSERAYSSTAPCKEHEHSHELE